MDVNENDNSIQNAVAQLLTPSPEIQEEQAEEEVLEQETLEEETQEVTEEEDTSEPEEDVEGEEEEADNDSDVGDSDEDEEPSEADETTSDDLFTVKVDGEEYEVNLEELKKGYQLEKNYTKRVQKLQEQSKELETLQTALTAERQQYLQLMELTASQQMAEVNNAKEVLKTIDKEADPIAYVKQQLRVQDIENTLRQNIQGFQQAKEQAKQQEKARLQEVVKLEQQKLAEVIPEWVSPEFQKGVIEYAKTQGYEDSDLSNIVTARDIAILNKARLYDDLISKKATVKKKRQPVVKKKVKATTPADSQTRKARAVKEQRQRLKRSGSVNDAAAALLSLTSK